MFNLISHLLLKKQELNTKKKKKKKKIKVLEVSLINQRSFSRSKARLERFFSILVPLVFSYFTFECLVFMPKISIILEYRRFSAKFILKVVFSKYIILVAIMSSISPQRTLLYRWLSFLQKQSTCPTEKEREKKSDYGGQ